MKIGVLEDYPSMERILALSLELAGYTVVGSQTISDFLACMISPVPPDLIIVDFRLLAEGSEIGITGVDVIRHIRTMFPNLPAIIISAAPLAKLEAAAVGLSRVKILRKPFKTSVLLETIKQMSAELA